MASSVDSALSGEKRLIILDLDGLLIHRVGNKILQRDGLWEFFRFLFAYYSVSVYTSMLRKNMNLTLSKIMSHKQVSQLIFAWSRENTYPDPEPNNEWDTVKRIDNRMISGFDQILIIDDDPRKLRFIPEHQILICKKFIIGEETGVLKKLLDDIKSKLS